MGTQKGNPRKGRTMVMYPFQPWAWPIPGMPQPGTPLPETDMSDTEQPSATTGPGDLDLAGYSVHATDGDIGTIDEASYDVGSARLVVDTGPWIFGRKVLLPAGLVRDVDHAEQKVHVACTRQQVKDSPEYEPDSFDKPEYRDRVGDYYTTLFRGGTGI